MLYHVFCITRHHSHTVGFHDASLLVKVVSFQRHPDGRRTSKVTWSILNTDRIIRMSDVDYYLVHKPFPSDFVWSLGESQLKKRKRHSTTVCCQFRKKGQFSFELSHRKVKKSCFWCKPVTCSGPYAASVCQRPCVFKCISSCLSDFSMMFRAFKFHFLWV